MKFSWLFLLAAASLVMLIPSFDQISMTSDGVNYVSTAENLVHRLSFRNFSGYVERIHPPGYAVALAAFILAGLDGHWAAIMLNWLALFACGVLTVVLLRDITQKTDDWRLLAGGLVVVTNPVLFRFANFALSETLFTATALLFVWLMRKAAR